ncbi:MAG: DUF1778 domain-containing protein [Thermoanaerobaculia bacterium]
MARPKKEETRRHSGALRLRLLPEHEQLIREAAAHAGVNLSDYMRDRLIRAARRDLGAAVRATGSETPDVVPA